MRRAELEAQLIAADQAGDETAARKAAAALDALEQQGEKLSLEDMLVQADEAGDVEAAKEYARLLDERDNGKAMTAQEWAQDARAAGDNLEANLTDQASKQAERHATRGSFVQPLIEGATAGFSDEIAGATGYLEALAEGAPKEERNRRYEKFKASNADLRGAFAARNPNTSTALELAGGLAFGAGGAARGAATTAGRAATGAALGAVSGAGHTEGTLTDRLKGAAVGGAMGAGFGSVAPAIAGRVARPVVRGVQRRLAGPALERAAQAGGAAAQKGSAGQLSLFGGSAPRPAAVRAQVKALAPVEREAFQKAFLKDAEVVIAKGLRPAELTALRRIARAVFPGQRVAQRKILSGISKLAKAGGKRSKTKTTRALDMAEKVLKQGTSAPAALVMAPSTGGASLMSPLARKAGQVAINRARSHMSQPFQAPAQPLQMNPEVLRLMMGFSAPQAGLLSGGSR